MPIGCRPMDDDAEQQSLLYFGSELHRTLHNLAAEADEQIAYLRTIFPETPYSESDEQIPIDELALEFGDMCLGIKNSERYRQLGLSRSVIDKLLEIDAMLGSMGGYPNPGVWAGRALKDSQHWRDVRERARSCEDLISRRTAMTGSSASMAGHEAPRAAPDRPQLAARACPLLTMATGRLYDTPPVPRWRNW